MSEQLIGEARFKATTAAAIRALEDLTEGHDLAVQALEDEALRNTPRRTGELAASFGARITAGVGELVNTADHAPYVNFGTRHMAARRFMPADPLDTITPIYLDTVDDIVGTIKGK